MLCNLVLSTISLYFVAIVILLQCNVSTLSVRIGSAWVYWKNLKAFLNTVFIPVSAQGA